MNILNNRTISSFPVSIGTGLMLETLFDNTIDRYDDNRDIPNKLNVNKYTHHIINLHTLIRNIVSSTSTKDTDALLNDKEFIRVCIDELIVLNSLYEETKCKLVIYIPNYVSKLKVLNSNKDDTITKPYSEYMAITSYIQKNMSNFNKIDIFYTDNIDFIKDAGNVLITTHYTLDLFSKLSKLELLESHTGKLKTKSVWNTKYHKLGSKDISNIPFIGDIYYILGDTTLVRPCGLPIRLALYSLAIEKNWTVRTTRDKVRHDINSVPSLKEILNNYKSIL